MPAELYVGDVFDSSERLTLKPVKLWDMTKPRVIAKLSNRYETGTFHFVVHFQQP